MGVPITTMKDCEQLTVHKLKILRACDHTYSGERTIIGVEALLRNFMILSGSYAKLATAQQVGAHISLPELTTCGWLL